MNNKPVAWLVDNQAYTIKEAAESLSRILETDAISLYTHPVKELTDEEIRALWKPMPDTKVYVRDLYAFARAVLRKAQEK